MRVLFVNRYYGDEQVPTGRMVQDVARVMRSDGHDVHVLTSRDPYVGKSSRRIKDSAGATVHRMWVGGGKSRLVGWLFFWVQVCIRVPLMPWERCVLLTDPPFMIFAAWLTRLLGRQRRKAYWWTMDLYPEALIADGILQADGVLQRLLSLLNDLGFSALAGVICLGERQRQWLEQYLRWPGRAGFCLTVPPWDYRPLKKVSPEENRFLAQHGWHDKKIALYAGNLGRAHSYQDILTAAHELNIRGDTHWKFVFVCRGASRVALEKASTHLDNVAVLDYVPPELTADLLWSATVHLITMADRWQGVVVPSKLYSVLQTEAPVLFIGPKDADTVNQIRHYHAGKRPPNGCGAEAVIQTLEELCNPKYHQEKFPDLLGADCIADFVTHW